MEKVKLRAIVLKEIALGEADKLIVLLAKGRGKVTVKAKGARNAKNKTSCGTTLFCYCDYIVLPSKGGNVLIQADVIESFYSLTEDMDKLAYASAALELAEKTCREEQSDDDIMRLLLKTFQRIAKGRTAPRTALSVFYIKFMQYFGCMPETLCLCQNTPSYADEMGFYCDSCRRYGSIFLSKSALRAIEHILGSDTKDIFSFSADDETLAQIETIGRKMISYFVDIKLNSLEFLKNIEK